VLDIRAAIIVASQGLEEQLDVLGDIVNCRRDLVRLQAFVQGEKMDVISEAEAIGFCEGQRWGGGRG
jgi:hypothetical protein